MMNKMDNKMDKLKQVRLDNWISLISREQSNGKGSHDNKYIIQIIHELPLEEVGCFQKIYVRALDGYFEFWKTEPEYQLMKKLDKFSEFTGEEKKFVLFFKEMSYRNSNFRELSNECFCIEVFKPWEFF